MLTIQNMFKNISDQDILQIKSRIQEEKDQAELERIAELEAKRREEEKAREMLHSPKGSKFL